MLHTLDHRAVDTLLDFVGPDAGAPYLVELRHLGGATTRPATVPGALGRRDGVFCLNSGAAVTTTPRSRPSSHRSTGCIGSWPRGAPAARGSTFLAGPDVTTDQVSSAYLPADLDRLHQIKQHVDPHDTFRAVVALTRRHAS